MRLLVSVRSAAEAALAASNGADIVDAKEPEAGPLGPVSGSVLRDIELALPSRMPLGVALGDAALPDELADVLDHVATPVRAGGTFLKVGFAGVSRGEQVAAVLRRAVDRARDLGPTVAVIAASYADCDRARSLSPERILDAAIGAGAAGALIDTWIKDGRGLLRHMSVGCAGRVDSSGPVRRSAHRTRGEPHRGRPPDPVGSPAGRGRCPRRRLPTWPGRHPRPPPPPPPPGHPGPRGLFGQPTALRWRIARAGGSHPAAAPVNGSIADGHGSCLPSAEATSVAVPWV